MEIISFFSFKGGVGRTALLTNLGVHWANEGKTVVLVDMDLAAPGLTLLPMTGGWLEKDAHGMGVGDLLTAFSNGIKEDNLALLPPSMLLRDMNDPTVDRFDEEAKHWKGKGRLLLIDAGSPRVIRPDGENASDGMPGDIPPLEEPADRDEGKERFALRRLAEAMRDDLEKWTWETEVESDAPVKDGEEPRKEIRKETRKIDYVLIDCRTGYSELIDLSLGFLADHMVLVSGLNAQNLSGLQYTLRALQGQNRVLLDEFPAKVTVALSPVPSQDDEDGSAALEKAHSVIQNAMRRTDAGVREATPPVYHLHYAPALASIDDPLIQRRPKSRYAREVKLIAKHLAGEDIFPWEFDAVADDAVSSVAERFKLGQGRVSIKLKGPKPSAQPADAPKRPNPATNLPAWHWALPEEQQTPEARRKHLRDSTATRRGVTLDGEGFLSALAWAGPLPKEERRKILDRLKRQTQAEVDETLAMLEDMRRQIIAMADRSPKQALALVMKSAQIWAETLNKKPATAARRFLLGPLSDAALFPAWKEWPEYWLSLARGLIFSLGEREKGLTAIEKAADAAGPQRDFVLGDAVGMAPDNHDDPSLRDALAEKARELAPQSPFVAFAIENARRPKDVAALRATAAALLDAPPDDADACYFIFDVVDSWLSDLIPRCDRLAERLGREEPDSARHHIMRGRIAWAKGEEADAEAQLRRATEADAEDADAWAMLGKFLMGNAERAEAAEEAFARALSLDSKNASAQIRLGRLLSGQPERLAEAEAALRQAARLQESSPAPWRDLGDLFSDLQPRLDEAEEVLRRAIKLNPQSPESHRILARFYAEHRRDYAAAERAFTQATEADPQNPAAWLVRGAFLADALQRLDAAAAAYQQARRLAPDDAGVWIGLGAMSVRRRQWATAIKDYQTGEKLEHPPCVTAGNLADLAWRLGAADVARRQGEAALAGLRRRSGPYGAARRLFYVAGLDKDMAGAWERAVAQERVAAWLKVAPHRADLCLAWLLFTLTQGDVREIAAALMTLRDNLQCHQDWAEALDRLYDLAGRRSDLREACRAAAVELLGPPGLSGFGDAPRPDWEMQVYKRFADGVSSGAGDPADLPLLCDDADAARAQLLNGG
jgi:tetratricopeptide (TPR) repeat protein/MinD-like ATPase involved in chromosome partitioning or flagellar assembly